jgi:hypothetical protein
MRSLDWLARPERIADEADLIELSGKRRHSRRSWIDR